jgi:four helix bundle protein
MLQSYKVRETKREMASSSASFETFENLEAYKFSREFRRAMYRVSRALPKFEMYELGSQIRRAAVSLTNNIAEGHGRFHYPDQIRFMLQARGSLEELLDDLVICEDEAYLSADDAKTRRELGLSALRVLNGYIRYLRTRCDSRSLREDSVPYVTM